MNFEAELQEKAEQIDQIIKAYLPKEEGYQKTVIEAMNYSILAGGKRLRPMLMQETFSLFGGNSRIVEPFMAAIEMIHTYSLVHDDLPSMDNDEYRRGRKTTHTVYGEGMAVLAGDGLLNFAFETACKAFTFEQATLEVAKAMTVFAEKAGIYGMIGGQTADIEAEKLAPEKITEELLLFIHKHKTAALLQSAMMVGAVLAGATDEEVACMEKAGYYMGMAFQIQDDILDVIGNQEILGKPIGSDEKNHKVTYVSINGLEKSKEDVKNFTEQAIQCLGGMEKRNIFLENLIRKLSSRDK